MSSPACLRVPDNSKQNKNTNIDLDTIFVKEIGQIGPFQLRQLAVLIVLLVFRSWSSSEYVFSTGRINNRCYIPGCDSEAEDALYSPAWVLSAVPSAGGSLASCQRYANITQLTQNYTCTPQLFNTSHIIPCDTYVYENTDTVVYDFDLGCDEWRRTLIGSVRMIGTCLSIPLTGYISDRWGRRTALAFNVMNAAWLGIIRYWASSYIVYLTSILLEMTFAGGVTTCSIMIVIETMGPKYRVACTALTTSFISMGQIMLAFIAMSVRNWRKNILSIYSPQFLSIAAVFLLSESVRWSMSKGRYDDAEKVLKKIAKSNKKNLSQETLDDLRQSHMEKIKIEQQKEDSEWLFMIVLRNKIILLRCLISAFNWIASVLIYQGLSLNAANLSGNRYLNYAAVVSVEIPGIWIGFLSLSRLGRKATLAGAYFICAVFQFTYVFISEDDFVLSLCAYLISNCASGMMHMSLHIYTMELFPTQQRHRLLAFCTFMGRIGAIMAPLTPAFGAYTFQELPFVLFGSCALLAGLLTLLLPETLRTTLPDTMREATTMGKNNNMQLK